MIKSNESTKLLNLQACLILSWTVKLNNERGLEGPKINLSTSAESRGNKRKPLLKSKITF